MTLGEIGRMGYRELPPWLQRIAVIAFMAGSAVLFGTRVLASDRQHEERQDARITAVEKRQDHSDSVNSTLHPMLRFLGCVERQRMSNRDPSACDYGLPPDVRELLAPPSR